MKVRIIYNLNGTVSIIHPAPNSRGEDEIEEQWFKRVFDKATPFGLEYNDIEKVQLPSSRRFRNAWVKDISGIKIDLPKSKEQVFVEVRRVRDKKLVETDGLMSRATDIGTIEEINTIKMQRQELRDLPQNLQLKLDGISTIEELEIQYPKELMVEEYLELVK